jgi:hypothetical protein
MQNMKKSPTTGPGNHRVGHRAKKTAPCRTEYRLGWKEKFLLKDTSWWAGQAVKASASRL